MIDYEVRFDTVDEMEAFFKRAMPRNIYDDVAQLQEQVAIQAQQITDLQDELDTKTADSGWQNLSLINGTEAYNEALRPKYRKIGNQVFLKGVVKNITAANTVFAQLPEGFRPTAQSYFIGGSATVNNGTASVATFYNCQVNADGTIRITTNSIGSYNANYYLRLNGSFLVD